MLFAELTSRNYLSPYRCINLINCPSEILRDSSSCPKTRGRNMTVILIAQFATCLLLVIAPNFSIAIEQQQQQQQQTSRQTTNTNQQKLITNNNNRIDWSNLDAANITNQLPELSTDWLMLGGSAESSDIGQKRRIGNQAQQTDIDIMVANEAKSSVSFASSSDDAPSTNGNSTLR